MVVPGVLDSWWMYSVLVHRTSIGDVLHTMRYSQKFKGDRITEHDLEPISMDNIVVEIPTPSPYIQSLDDLPIRVKTRYSGGKRDARRRVVSTPVFDVVTGPPYGLEQPPALQDSFPVYPSSRSGASLTYHKRSPLAGKDIQSSGNQFTTTSGKRHVSMPVTPVSHRKRSSSPLKQEFGDGLSKDVLASQSSSNISDLSCSQIIQFYKDNSPFQPLEPEQSPEEYYTALEDSTSPSETSSDDFSIVEENFDSSLDPWRESHKPLQTSSILAVPEEQPETKPYYRTPPTRPLNGFSPVHHKRPSSMWIS
ncbi:unnamed protein product [Cyberlindnera jadinii]|uniref:Uncharacterized protein n=1 Tax=Cyberlindnera jadinii (strain ATCC 18201 / CBS 1600 / BCRC 20928 / JCM 3617 / NBRC 0987 / NRRL Y-1542) TaxID=983966 RepID=A0A0H5BZI9_CYBJN|nr:unnamed protein product [Cyberlindnera jadinii]